MQPNNLSTIRKRPSQRRSVLTFESILEACAQLLNTMGHEEITTNHLAEKAGVSIGTLYQYFPHKESVFQTLVYENATKRIRRMKGKLGELKNLPLFQVCTQLINTYVDALYANQAIEQFISTKIPLTRVEKQISDLEQEFYQLFLLFLQPYKEELPHLDLEKTVYVLFYSIKEVAVKAITDDTTFQGKEELQEYLVKLALRFIQSPATPH